MLSVLLVLLSMAAACSDAESAGAEQLDIASTARAAYDAGFRTEEQLVAIVAIGIAESSLRPDARNFHPEYGFRPASDTIGVTGPDSAWNDTKTAQLNSDRGVFQISSHWWPQYTDAQADDVDQAAAIAYTISKSGRDFEPWDTHKNGAAQEHYDRAVRG
jgi:hypothetical protein